MKKSMSEQSGFGTLVILFVALVVVVLAASGWVVYQHHQNSVKAKNVAASTSPQTTGQQKSTTSTQPTQTVTPYLTIKEWGVKLPLTDNIKDAYYVVATNSTDTMWIGLSSLDSNGCAAALGNTAGASAPIAALVRVSPTELEPVQGKPYSQLYPGITLGNYYYAYINGTKGKTCASTSTLQSVDSAFTSSAKSAVAASN